MKEMKLKICGMRDANNIREVAALAPDLMGFIFYGKSPRFVGEEFSIPAELPPSVKRVGVFVNESVKEIVRIAKRLGLDFVQLHGSESVEHCRELRAHNVHVIKVFQVDDEFDFKVTEPFEAAVDFFLFDTKGKYYGGNAVPFNWSVLKKYQQRIPFFLSGGLSPDNVSEALHSLEGMNVYSLDVNSGVEVAPAQKDIGKIEQLKKILISKTQTI
jgi:phosphoribosylanthranilate isomerase